MKQVCIVTGGGSGMGLETAKIVGQNHHIILVGRTVSKLENALDSLHALNIEAEAFPCDISDRFSVQKLAEYAKSVGEIKIVIHAAGISPHMSSGDTIFNINAMGTIFINEELSKIMSSGSCILNVSSMSAYMLPDGQTPKEIYKLSLNDTSAFQAAMLNIINMNPENAPNTAYVLSKNFVIWYTEQMACIYGKDNIRVVSISPGTFKTPMGELEGEDAANFAIQGALGRVGEPEEIANLMAFMVSDKCSYLTGVDILCDGGTIASLHTKTN